MPPLRMWFKKLLFPGLDLHTRCRYHALPVFLKSGDLCSLDAGCGNGALSWAAYRMGNRVLGLTVSQGEVDRARTFFSWLGTDSLRLTFQRQNLYDLEETQYFDQIICSETLEHIQDDRKVVERFYAVLKPGGILHLCAPYALHPDHALGREDRPEDGGHVRDGYTLPRYRALLEPCGFEIVKTAGFGGPIRVLADHVVRWVRNTAGDWLALPFFLILSPLCSLDPADPRVPYSLYVQAVKNAGAASTVPRISRSSLIV